MTNSSELQVVFGTYMVFQTCPYACGFNLLVVGLLPLEMSAVLGFECYGILIGIVKLIFRQQNPYGLLYTKTRL
ncbi:MAG: hypothetical protein PUP92_15030 [Rhizonema sp. PD38]|nr:hypothetical protein [Rhizonema sp. PD38]